MTRRYLAVYEWSGRNFSGFSPDVPGCASSAKTLTAMRRSLREALESHLQWMANDGDPIPEAVTRTVEFGDDDPEHPFPPGYYFVVEKLEVTLPEGKKLTPAEHDQRSSQAA